MLSFNQKRIVAGGLLALTLFSVANWYFEWGLFGRFAKQVMVGVFVAMFIYQVRVGPTLEEVENYRAGQRGGGQLYAPRNIVLILLFIMLGLAAVWVVRFARGLPVDWSEFAMIEGLMVIAGLIAWSDVKQRKRRMEK